ncbi:MAG: nucleotide exchange factor GrpE [Defluviitaleaceae bacterium]|nr:nucleotide exchange factor GrpE [Defluviitaleaceae bacterium]
MNSTHNNLQKSWGTLLTATENYARQCTDILFNECNRRISWKLLNEAAKLSKFGSHDEEVYNHCKRLVLSYKETVDLHDRFHDEIVSHEVREIIDGIVTVLVSRLREFEEMNIDTIIKSDTNPVTVEKNAIIAQATNNLVKCINNQRLTFSEEMSAFCVRWMRQNLAKEFLLEAISKEILPVIYKSYCSGLELCKSQLNDINHRKKIQLYLTLMEDELEILSTIIKIQVKALEQAVEYASNPLEKIAVHKILSLLREAYQHFGRASTEIAAVFRRLEEDKLDKALNIPVSYDSFEKFLLDRFRKIRFSNSNRIKEKVGIFKSQIENEIDSFLGRYKLDFYKSIYRFRRMASVEIMLADEMINIFVNLHNAWPVLEQDAEKELQQEILQGVAETIEIKVDGLKESTLQFKEECAKAIADFSAKNNPPTDEKLQTAHVEAWRLWTENSEDFFQSYPEAPVFAEFSQYYEKSTSRCQENLEKKLMKFKREVLLYEISTYEEIIAYSVSRLREDEATQYAAELADTTLAKLEVLLKKNNIELIRPNPHDTFNPKEHEILMAETLPEFKKGEIVKLMNSGYRQRDTVLLRANVIVAR